MKTLATEIHRLREGQELSMDDLATRAGLRQSTIWKVESGRTIKGATLHNIVTKGLGFPTDSKEYQQVIALWAKSHGLIIKPNAQLKSGRQHAKASIDEIVSTCSSSEIKALESAMANEEQRGALIALAKYFWTSK